VFKAYDEPGLEEDSMKIFRDVRSMREFADFAQNFGGVEHLYVEGYALDRL
jgi:hypothetical protein